MKSSFLLRKTFFFFLIFGAHFTEGMAQDIPIGTWRYHPSFQAARRLAIGSAEIYSAGNNSLFSLDLSSNSLNPLSRLNGLSETVIDEMAFTEDQRTLIIAYDNSTVDLIKENSIVEIASIRNSNIQGSRRIRHIFSQGDLAYLSGDFGVIVLDTRREEIRESFRNLGSGGEELAILSSTSSQDSLFLASPQGVLRGSLSDNLQDFNNWTFFSSESGLPEDSILGLVSLNNQVYALDNNSQLYQYQHSGQWTAISFPDFSEINLLRSSGGQLLLANDQQFARLDENNQLTINEDPLFQQIQDIGRDAQGNYWLSDRVNGLLGNPSGPYQSFFPNGPARAEVQRVVAAQGQIFALSGGADNNQNPLGRDAGYYVFDGSLWQNFNAFDPNQSRAIPDIRDLNDFAFDSRRGLDYFASFQSGILSRDREGNSTILNQNTAGSTLRLDANNQLKISALALDFEGRLWMTNPGGQNSLHVLNSDDSWQAFPPFVNQAINPLDILIDNFSNFKWILLDPNLGGGIWVLDDRNSLQRFLSSSTNNGSLPSSRVNALAQDREGQIWAGTDRGVAVFLDPFSIFQGNVNAITPIFELRPLLRAERVTSIAIDGGNRKWFGTESGVWLFNADTDELIHHFTERNSPLLSNIILDLSIDPRSGELFIATDRGLVSYRGGASEGTSNFQNVRIFPNPVLPGFEGEVGISGLAEGASVKITDVSGRLFFEGKAEGGTATWNLKDYTGFRARSGVYLVFSANQDGSESFIGKIAVIE